MCVILHVSVITQGEVSALMVAAMKGKTKVLLELVKAGANVEMQTEVCQNVFVTYTMYQCIMATSSVV